MGELRHVGAERPEEQDVLGRVGDVVLAADDVADRHVGVVDDDHEVVERRAIAADDDQVAAQVVRVEISTWPRTMSSNATTPSPTRKRMTGLSRSASLARRSSVVRLAQRPT